MSELEEAVIEAAEQQNIALAEWMAAKTNEAQRFAKAQYGAACHRTSDAVENLREARQG